MPKKVIFTSIWWRFRPCVVAREIIDYRWNNNQCLPREVLGNTFSHQIHAWSYIKVTTTFFCGLGTISQTSPSYPSKHDALQLLQMIQDLIVLMATRYPWYLYGFLVFFRNFPLWSHIYLSHEDIISFNTDINSGAYTIVFSLLMSASRERQRRHLF